MKKNKKALFCRCLYLVMLCSYLGAIMYINLFPSPAFYKTDMYADVMVAVEMWEQKSLFPGNWLFGNQLYCFATPVVSALFYGMTGQPFLAMGIASCVMTIVVMLSFDWMLKAVYHQPEERLVGAVSLLGVVVFFGKAVWFCNGWQLLFTLCSYYACYALLAFLAFGCYLRGEEKTPWGILAAVVVLSFAAGIQSPRQTAVMIAPLLAVECLHLCKRLCRKERIFTERLLNVCALLAANILGLAVKQFIPVRQNSIYGQVAIVPAKNLLAGLSESVRNLTSLFEIDGAGCPPAYCAGIVLFVVLSVIVLWKERRDKELELLGILMLSVLTILGIDFLTSVQVRGIYYFMGYPLLACCAVLLFAKGKTSGKTSITLALCVMFIISFQGDIFPVLRKSAQREDNIHYQISAELLENGFTTVYSHWNGGDRVAMASGGTIRAGFWDSANQAFIQMQYLCDPAVYDADAGNVAYIFYSGEEVDAAVKKAADLGVTLKLFQEYPDADTYIYTAPVNLMSFLQKK